MADELNLDDVLAGVEAAINDDRERYFSGGRGELLLLLDGIERMNNDLVAAAPGLCELDEFGPQYLVDVTAYVTAMRQYIALIRAGSPLAGAGPAVRTALAYCNRLEFAMAATCLESAVLLMKTVGVEDDRA